MLIALILGTAAFPAEGGDLRKAKAYVAEVQKHLLTSYLERERLTAAGLAAAAFKALDDGLREAALPAARAALAAEETVAGAFEAIAKAEPAADLAALADRAARAMVAETGDPFCRILTQEELTRLVKLIGGQGRESTAGVSLQPKGRGYAVAFVQAGTPADEEGLEVGDELLAAGARELDGLPPEQAAELLKLPAGGTLELRVKRGTHVGTLRLRAPKAATSQVRAQALGRGVGYVRLTLFDGNAVRDVEKALQDLSRGDLRGLIFDLRRNPGGALPSATGIADLFLGQDLLIAKTVCHYEPSLGGLKFPGLTPPAEYKTRKASDFEDLPMVCLVDGGSASASELLAGALKDHRRAVLVGARTYGKGVGQSPIVLSSMFLQRYLYLTVLRYSTPRGDEVQHVGVAADVEALPEPFDPGRWALRADGRLDRWLDGRWGAALEKAAEWDGFETSAWEGFDVLFADLKTALSKDVVREELRRAARRRASTAWACDLQGDRVLQRGLVELLDRMK